MVISENNETITSGNTNTDCAWKIGWSNKNKHAIIPVSLLKMFLQKMKTKTILLSSISTKRFLIKMPQKIH